MGPDDTHIEVSVMKTILILEDDPSLLKFLRRSLIQYAVIEASTAEKALWYFKYGNCRVGLLITAVNLPVSSGAEVAMLLRSEVPDLPVVLTSRFPVSDWPDLDAVALDRLRSDSVIILQEPFESEELLMSVRELIGLPQAERAGTA
jgi:DNA-binding response OmpR family regulator